MKARLKGTAEWLEVTALFFADGEHYGFRLGDDKEHFYYADALEFERETDWAAYRREAAKAAMQGILSGGADWQSTLTECREDGRCEYPSEIANFAVACADALIKQLQEK